METATQSEAPARVLIARYGSTCPGCGQRIYPGDVVTIDEGTRHMGEACAPGHHDSDEAVTERWRENLNAANRFEHWKRTGVYDNRGGR
jgi:hypothetical protein